MFETFKLTLFDLEKLGLQGDTTIKTFDGLIGRCTARGIVVKETKINDDTGSPYSVNNRYNYRELYDKIKTVKKGRLLIADRRWAHQTLMTTGKGYRR